VLQLCFGRLHRTIESARGFGTDRTRRVTLSSTTPPASLPLMIEAPRSLDSAGSNLTIISWPLPRNLWKKERNARTTLLF
jgi:hypothetical protein